MKRFKEWFSAFAGMAIKSKALIQAFKVIKVLKVVTPLITVSTMFISTIVYGWIYGWAFGVALVAMIFIHEMGHVVALKQRGYPFKAPVFIPLLGAVIFAPSNMDRDTEAYVGIGGPVLGTAGALLAYLIWFILPGHPQIWLLMSYIGVSINLFNMIPISPLDGGRITQATGAWFVWVGIAVLFFFTLYTNDAGLLVIWLLVIFSAQELTVSKKLILGSIIFVTMLVLFAIDYGQHHTFATRITDVLFGSMFLCLIAVNYYFRNKETTDQKKASTEPIVQEELPRPSLHTKARIVWFCAYFLLVALLSFTLWIQKGQIHLGPLNHQQKEKHVNPQIS